MRTRESVKDKERERYEDKKKLRDMKIKRKRGEKDRINK
jgi:hypothetical protein